MESRTVGHAVIVVLSQNYLTRNTDFHCEEDSVDDYQFVVVDGGDGDYEREEVACVKDVQNQDGENELYWGQITSHMSHRLDQHLTCEFLVCRGFESVDQVDFFVVVVMVAVEYISAAAAAAAVVVVVVVVVVVIVVDFDPAVVFVSPNTSVGKRNSVAVETSVKGGYCLTLAAVTDVDLESCVADSVFDDAESSYIADFAGEVLTQASLLVCSAVVA